MPAAQAIAGASVDARAAPDALEAVYAQAVARPSDIHEHLPLLRALAEKCEHVTELGLRWANGSTVAFLAAQPRALVSWDLDPRAVVSGRVQALLGMAGRTRFQPRVGDTLEVEVEETDLLFFDTYHTGKHLYAELMRHGDKARKYLVFHDTITFGIVGEDGVEPGLRAAIKRFRRERWPLWRVLEDRENCNGLVVLQRETDWERENGQVSGWIQPKQPRGGGSA